LHQPSHLGQCLFEIALAADHDLTALLNELSRRKLPFSSTAAD
jgi:hypothetical protein